MYIKWASQFWLSIHMDLVAELVRKVFGGLICMSSATTVLRMRRATGRAHCVFGKDESMQDVINSIKVAYVRHVLRRGSSPEPPHIVPGTQCFVDNV